MLTSLTNENENLKMQLNELTEKFNKLTKENKELKDKCQDLEERLEWAYDEMSER